MKFSFIFIFIFLLAVPLISAQPTSTQTNLNTNVGVDIKFPAIGHIRQNENFIANFHVFNKSTGLLLTNDSTSCEFHLYNNGGNHILIVNQFEFDIGDRDFEIEVNKGNFTRLGAYSYVVQCNTTNLGGFASVGIEVTADGFESKTFPTQFFIILFAFLLIVVGLLKERWRMFKYLGSLLAMVMAILTFYPGYSFINWTTLEGKALGSILFALGFYFLIEDSFSREKQADSFESGEEF